MNGRGQRFWKIGTICLLLFILILSLCACQLIGNQESEEELTTDPIIPQEPHSADTKEDPDEQVSTDFGENEKVAKLIFIGDTMMDGKVAAVMQEKGNDYPLSQFMPILEKADLVIANLETAVGTSGNTLANEKKYAFQTHPDRFELFAPLRQKLLFSLANNHGLDAPLHETMEALNELNFQYVGIGRNQHEAFQPYIQEINGVKIGVIGTTRVIPTASWAAGAHVPGLASAYTDEPLLQTIRDLYKQVDYVIVYIHWGEELADEPNAIQVQLEEKMRQAGAHLIIGSHPHVLQGIHWVNDKQLTAYSLGNFVFSTSRYPIANDTMALEIHLSQEKIELVQAWPGQIQFGLIQSLQKDEDKNRIFQRLRTLSPTIRIDDNGQITNLK